MDTFLDKLCGYTAVYVPFGVVAWFYANRRYARVKELMAHGIETQGTITKVKEYNLGAALSFEYQFQAGAGVPEKTTQKFLKYRLSDPDAYKEGTKLPVVYLEGRPSINAIKEMLPAALIVESEYVQRVKVVLSLFFIVGVIVWSLFALRIGSF